MLLQVVSSWSICISLACFKLNTVEIITSWQIVLLLQFQWASCRLSNKQPCVFSGAFQAQVNWKSETSISFFCIFQFLNCTHLVCSKMDARKGHTLFETSLDLYFICFPLLIVNCFHTKSSWSCALWLIMTRYFIWQFLILELKVNPTSSNFMNTSSFHYCDWTNLCVV